MIWGNKVSLKVGNKRTTQNIVWSSKTRNQGENNKRKYKKIENIDWSSKKKNQGENKMTKCNHN